MGKKLDVNNNKEAREMKRYKRNTWLTVLPVLALFAPAVLAGAADADPHAHHKQMHTDPDNSASTASIRLSDTPLLDHSGRQVNFKSDVVGDNIVVVDFVYTTCTTVCPVLTAVFLRLQDKLAAQLQDNVRLISLTVDPVRDNPQRLAEYSRKHNAGPGWIWLTGDKPNVDHVLETLGAYTADFTEHPSLILVGDPRSGKWSRFFGFPDPEKIIAEVNKLAAARNTVNKNANKHIHTHKNAHKHAHAAHKTGEPAL